MILTARTLPKAQAAEAEVSALQLKGTLSALALDVTDKTSIEAAAAEVEKTFGRIDVLINNAGVGGSKIDDIYTQFRTVLDTNVIGPAVVSAMFRPLLLKSSNPYSIFVSSGQRTLLRNAHQKPPHFAHFRDGQFAYQVSKAALNMLAVLEARDFGGIKVFAFSPGFVRSGIRGESEEERSGWGGAGDPEEAGRVVLDILGGGRDADVGCLVHKDGVYEW